MNRTMDIEAALRWAYCEEFPKAAALRGADWWKGLGPRMPSPGWTRMARFAELETLVDEGRSIEVNRFGMVPDGGSHLPHPVAEVIFEAVLALGDEVNPPEGVLADLPVSHERDEAERQGRLRAMREASGVWTLRDGMAELMRRAAVLGAPELHFGIEVVRKPVSRNGRPLWFRKIAMLHGEGEVAMWHQTEIDGFDHKKRRPYADAYQRFYLDPNPAGIAEDRILYAVWREALDRMASDLGSLDIRDAETGIVIEQFAIKPSRRAHWLDVATVLADSKRAA